MSENGRWQIAGLDVNLRPVALGAGAPWFCDGGVAVTRTAKLLERYAKE